ncbi:MAG: hypothetical protein MUC81_09885 [Bacteroidia bacterium]|nr:hypothetical protein [Bacteroidia bacterium]
MHSRTIVSAIYFCLIAIVFGVFIEACKHENYQPPESNLTIKLKWNKGYNAETIDKAATGLLWCFSFLGAELPKGSFEQAVTFNQQVLTVQLNKLGFNSQAIEAFSKLIPIIKSSEEYKITGAIDLGRFIMLTLNSSYHYYAIVGMPLLFNEFKAGKRFDNKLFVSTNSKISRNDRKIQLPDSNNTSFKEDAYIANECEGRINLGQTTIVAHEVSEQMPNGQFRFAVYDTTGSLLTAAKGEAGKPAKCLWCHEIYVSPLFAPQTDVPGYYSAEEFNRIVARNMLRITAYRNTLTSDLDFKKRQDHTLMELLYISFTEPSAERLSLEWGLTVEVVKEKLKGLTTHRHDEFDYLGDLYYREEVEPFAPFAAIKTPTSAREKSSYEPRLIP